MAPPFTFPDLVDPVDADRATHKQPLLAVDRPARVVGQESEVGIQVLAFEVAGIAVVAANAEVFDPSGGELLVEGLQFREPAFRKTFVPVSNVDDDGVPDVPGIEDCK